LFAGDQAIHST